MADTLTCPVCDASIQRQIIEAEGCEFCGATLPLIKIMNDIMEEHYDELEAAGLNIHTRIDPPPVITYLRSLWFEKEELRTQNEKLKSSIKGIDMSLQLARSYL